jgi:serine/threonine protein kinase
MSRLASKGLAVEPPLQIGDYQLEKVIGQGTYGKVRLGLNIHTGESVIHY